MKVTGFSSFGIFALLAISLVFACNELVNCSFADEKSGSSDVPYPEVDVLPPSLPSLSSEAAPCSAELPLLQAPFAEMIPCELWPEIFSSCTADTLRSCIQVCHSWENIINSEYDINKLPLLVWLDEEKFDHLLIAMKMKTQGHQKGLLQRFYDEKLVRPKVLMDLIVRLFMMADVFSIVTDLLRDPSIPTSKLFQLNCRSFSVDRVLACPEVAVRNLYLTPELLRAVFKDLTPKNFRPWLYLPRIFRQLMKKAIKENTALAMQIYPQLKRAVHLPAQDFPTLSFIELFLPLFFPISKLSLDPRLLHMKLAKIRSTEETMPKEMSDKILDILKLMEPMSKQLLEMVVPHLCPSFLKGWKKRETEAGKLVIDQFLNISQHFKELNNGVGYGEALLSSDLVVIKQAIASLANIKSVPFFVYRPLIVTFIYNLNPWIIYDTSQAPFSGIEYPLYFMEDLCVLASECPLYVITFLKFLDLTQRSKLASYSAVLTANLFSHFKGFTWDFLSDMLRCTQYV